MQTQVKWFTQVHIVGKLESEFKPMDFRPKLVALEYIAFLTSMGNSGINVISLQAMSVEGNRDQVNTKDNNV